jgi:hypothetical protein
VRRAHLCRVAIDPIPYHVERRLFILEVGARANRPIRNIGGRVNLTRPFQERIALLASRHDKRGRFSDALRRHPGTFGYTAHYRAARCAISLCHF